MTGTLIDSFPLNGVETLTLEHVLPRAALVINLSLLPSLGTGDATETLMLLADKEALAGAVSAFFSQRGSKGCLTIATDVPTVSNTSSLHGQGEEAICSLQLRVPNHVQDISLRLDRGNVQVTSLAGKRVAVFLRNGDLTVRDLNGMVIVSSGRGGISARDLNGEVLMSTGKGVIDSVSCRGIVRLHTGEGDLAVRDFRGTVLSVTSARGDVNLSNVQAGKLTIKGGEGSCTMDELSTRELSLEVDRGQCVISGHLTDGEHAARVKRGEITLRLPQESPLKFDLSTGAGEIHTTFRYVEVGRRGRPGGRAKRLVGNQYGGSVSLSVKVGRGDIRLLGFE